MIFLTFSLKTPPYCCSQQNGLHLLIGGARFFDNPAILNAKRTRGFVSPGYPEFTCSKTVDIIYTVKIIAQSELKQSDINHTR